ncbi:hypothetical protein [Stenotrophomonas sp. PS02289]|uniref:hypothetical protein n=1 Tax=Stenotrophomonas sp. PS02289 TaxID=2991422 RepID=UPI00249C558F|nr:hypothetical protein [Stenotrophomonas sp. PS02289]
MSRPYVPINCEFHDVLETVAVQRRAVPIVIEENGSMQTLHNRIVDITAHDGVETMRLDDGRIVRLDAIVTVDGVHRDAYPTACILR